MIDIRYHIATLIAIFLALGVGILIGSTVVGSDVLIDQQKKIIDQLESQFHALRQSEENLTSENEFMTQVLNQYEEYNKAILPSLIKDRLSGYQAAVVVTGGEDMPAGMLNSLSLAGVKVTTTTVILPDISLSDRELRAKLCDFYGKDEDTAAEELRPVVAQSVGNVLTSNEGEAIRQFLQENQLVKFHGDYTLPVNGVLIVGGANNVANYFPETIDVPLIQQLLGSQKSVFGLEVSQINHSYMQIYQSQKVSTIDDIDIIPGQVALILAMEGEVGDYGVKPTAKKFMPSLPLENLGGV